MKKEILSFALAACISLTAAAQNPIAPAGMYIADPSAHVWKDGKMYVYGSKDESPDYYCSKEHHVLSSSDLIHWDVAKHVFSYRDEFLYAPDCQYRNGNYYLYFCTSSAKEGVAVSPSPTGPFRDAKIIDLHGKSMIDPGVFIDDDGQAYYVWGQFSAKMAKLKPNMTEIDSTTLHDGVVTEKDHFFHEGCYMVKRNGIYYLVYTDISRKNRATCIGYATSDKPFGPYTYRGVIIDNDGCDPASWNNHGSIVEMNGQWYVFYHRSTHNSVTMRKACIEPIYFRPDGAIPEVPMTTQGVCPPLDACRTLQAERACLLFGQTYIAACAPDNECLTHIGNGDKAAYKYLDFKDGVDSIFVHIKPGASAGKIDLLLDQPWHGSVATIDIPAQSAGDQPLTVGAKISEKIAGVHALWLQFSGRGEDLFEVDWIKFSK